MHEPLPRRTAVEADVTITHVLHRDYETRSQVDLKKVGAANYAADPSTEVLCMAFAAAAGPVQLWVWGDPIPAEFFEAEANSNWRVTAHGDHFETAIEQHVLHPRIGWPIVPIERHVCTMARCLSAGLPAKLAAVADALELQNRKDAAGERLMHQTSKPRKPRKGEDPAGMYWFDDQERLDRLYSYCKQDVEVERELHDRVPPLSAAEQALWALSGRINERGFHVDRHFAEAARRIAQAAAPEIDAELTELTAGAVTGINQVARMLQWLQDQGCTVQTLGRKTVGTLLEQAELPSTVCFGAGVRPLSARGSHRSIQWNQRARGVPMTPIGVIFRSAFTVLCQYDRLEPSASKRLNRRYCLFDFLSSSPRSRAVQNDL